MSNAQYGPPHQQGWPQQSPPQPYGPPPGMQYPNPQQMPGPDPQQPVMMQPYVIPPKPFNHGLHLIFAIFSAGLWVPFWILMWAAHSRRATVVGADGKRRKV